MVLFDITPALLEIARQHVASAGVAHRVQQIAGGSITDMSAFPDASFDAVVCLGGPLSHVAGEENRRQAGAEPVRVAKPGA